MAARFEYHFTDENGVLNAFGIHGVSDNVAKGIRNGLRNVPNITNVTAERITENREAVTGPEA